LHKLHKPETLVAPISW